MYKFELEPKNAKMGCASSSPQQQGRPAANLPTAQQQASTDEAAEAGTSELMAADEARVAKMAAMPLPKGSEWHLCGGAELEPLLAYTDVVDAAWLLKLAKGEVMPERKGVVPAWQELPSEAKLDLATLRKTTMALKLPVAVLSYGRRREEAPTIPLGLPPHPVAPLAL